MGRIAAYNTGFASGGVTCKLVPLCFVSSVVLIDSFVLRNPPERQAENDSGIVGRPNKENETSKNDSRNISI